MSFATPRPICSPRPSAACIPAPDRDRAADRERLLLRLRVPGADRRGGAREDRGGDPARAERPVWERRGRRRRGQAPVCRAGRGLQGRARRHRGRRHLALHAGRLHRPLPRPSPPGLEADQGDQADRARRRLLARRRNNAADADLRDGVLLAGRPRRVPRADRGGKRRDHRRLATQLDLVHLSDHAPGMPFWHPGGW